MIGHYSSTLSDKKRVAVPKKYRQELGERMIVAKWYEGCLVLISEKNWQGLMGRLTGSASHFTAPVRDTDRFILGSAFELNPDNQGRVILPESLVDYAALKGEVMFIGLGDRVEIWNKSEWNKKEKLIAKAASELVEKIAKEGV